MIIQSGGPTIAEFFHEMLKGFNHGRWQHHYLEEIGSRYNMVIGRRLTCAGAVQEIEEIAKKDKLCGITTISSNIQFEQRKNVPYHFDQ